jgi:CHAT domain-containing protein/Flp pilus assembly protein TadD
MKTTPINTFYVIFQILVLSLALFMGSTNFVFAEQPSPPMEPEVKLTFNPQTEPVVKPTLIIQSLWEQWQEQREQRKQQQNPNNEADSMAELMEQLSPLFSLLKELEKHQKANPSTEQQNSPEISRQSILQTLKQWKYAVNMIQIVPRWWWLAQQYEVPGEQPEFQRLTAKLLAVFMDYEPSNVDSVDAFIKQLLGQKCEKTDEQGQQRMVNTLKKLVGLLKTHNHLMFALSKWLPQAETVERMMNLSPRPATSTQIPSNEVIDKAIKSVIPITDEMLAAIKRICGDNHIRVARGLYALSELYRAQADYEHTTTLLIKAKQILTTDYPKHIETVFIYANLGAFYASIGDFINAKHELVQAVELAQSLEALGPNHPNTVSILQNLSGVYLGLGDYANAERLIEKSLNALDNLKPVTESEFQFWSRELMRLLYYKPDRDVEQRYSMAYTCALLGDYEEAKRQFDLALTRLEQEETALPSLEEAMTHHGLGWVYQQQGNYIKAEAHYRQVLENMKHFVLSRDSIILLATQVNLGYLYYLQGKLVKAEQVLKRAITQSSKLSVSEEVQKLSKGLAFYSLGLFYQWSQQFDKAETHLQEALNIITEFLGQHHPSTVEIMQQFIALQFDQQTLALAVAMAKALQPDSEKVLKHVLAFGTEQQRLAYQKRSYPYDLLARVANETGEAMPLANAILHNKGIVLDSLMEDYQLAGSPEIKDKMLSLKGQLMMLMMAIHQDNSDSAILKRAHQREKLERQLKQLESGLAQQVGEARQAFEVNVERVQKVLSKDSVLVEFIRYKHFVGRQDRQAYYGAVIIPKEGKPTWAALGTAESIEPQIVAYQQMMRCEKDCPDYEEETVMEILQTLYQSIWAPIEEQFPKGIKTVILSPDGELNFVSFATLLTPPDSDFLVQKFDLYYVASGRDLLRKPKSTEQSTMMIYALSDWNQSSVVAKTRSLVNEPLMSSVERQAYLDLTLELISGTLPEANALKQMAQSKNWMVKTFVNAEATEKPLYELEPSPRILHFATHGVFLQPTPEKFVMDFMLTSGGTQSQYLSPVKFLMNPMRRSFIALSGAQTTLNAWRVGDAEKLPHPLNDGILTAEEVSSLKLENTWLTMFSACETGRGEGRSGEGVLGLRRGFVRAGTQNLLMTLWPYKDGVDEIVDFEVEFYETAIKTKNAPKALNDVQRQWLPKIWEEPIHDVAPLLDSVRLIGPFVMSFQGPLGK